jgi:hypothetical protein
MLTLFRILLGAACCIASLLGGLALLFTSGAGLAFIVFLLGQTLCALVMPELPSARPDE